MQEEVLRHGPQGDDGPRERISAGVRVLEFYAVMVETRL